MQVDGESGFDGEAALEIAGPAKAGAGKAVNGVDRGPRRTGRIRKDVDRLDPSPPATGMAELTTSYRSGSRWTNDLSCLFACILVCVKASLEGAQHRAKGKRVVTCCTHSL
jgi:hypothetical protein